MMWGFQWSELKPSWSTMSTRIGLWRARCHKDEELCCVLLLLSWKCSLESKTHYIECLAKKNICACYSESLLRNHWMLPWYIQTFCNEARAQLKPLNIQSHKSIVDAWNRRGLRYNIFNNGCHLSTLDLGRRLNWCSAMCIWTKQVAKWQKTGST